MKWYWIVLIIYAYIVIGAVVSALILGTTDDDAFPALVMFWPIAVIVVILALPIKLIFDIFDLH